MEKINNYLNSVSKSTQNFIHHKILIGINIVLVLLFAAIVGVEIGILRCDDSSIFSTYLFTIFSVIFVVAIFPFVAGALYKRYVSRRKGRVNIFWHFLIFGLIFLVLSFILVSCFNSFLSIFAFVIGILFAWLCFCSSFYLGLISFNHMKVSSGTTNEFSSQSNKNSSQKQKNVILILSFVVIIFAIGAAIFYKPISKYLDVERFKEGVSNDVACLTTVKIPIYIKVEEDAYLEVCKNGYNKPWVANTFESGTILELSQNYNISHVLTHEPDKIKVTVDHSKIDYSTSEFGISRFIVE